MPIGLRITQLPFIMILLAIFSAVTAGGICIQMATKSAVVAAEERLSALQATRQVALVRYLKSIEQDLSVVSTNGETRQALADFIGGWNDVDSLTPADKTRVLKGLYIKGNKNPVGSKYLLDYATDGSTYSEAHKKHHPWFRQFLTEKGYYDIFLIAPDGTIVYTVFKEEDFATNVMTGSWRETDIGRVFREVKENPRSGFRSFADFKPYVPSNGAPASFIAAPILGDGGVFEGVIAFQMPIGRINEIMQSAVGMGETGETYIVGNDYLMRSDSRFSRESTVLKTRIVTSAVKNALNQRKGVEFIKNQRGIDILSAFGSIDFIGVRWGVLAEVTYAEIMKPINEMRLYAVIGTGVSLLFIALVAFFAATRITASVSGKAVRATDLNP